MGKCKSKAKQNQVIKKRRPKESKASVLKRKQWSSEDMKAAIQVVVSDTMSQRKACQTFNVPHGIMQTYHQNPALSQDQVQSHFLVLI